MAFFKKKEKKSRFTRIDNETWKDNETGEIITSVLPANKARQIARSVLRQGKLKIFLLLALLLIAVFFILALLQEKSGNFTINLDRLELFRKGISISETADFQKPTARLTAKTVIDVTNIAASDIPKNVDETDGDHSGKGYLAFTFYIRNAGKEPVAITSFISMDSATKGAENAVRVAVWKNGIKTVYAMPSADGSPEPGCISFLDNEIVYQDINPEYPVGSVDKYTVVIWLDGDDPECVDSIIGGALEFSMHFASAGEDDTSLLDKFIQDIRDSISGNDPIGASGTENPYK